MNAHTTFPKWLKLDNAAKIYPAAKNRNWAMLFRMSATLTEEVDPVVLQQALNRVVTRFPSFATKLRRGLFWYYLEHIDGAPYVREDGCSPCLPLRPNENDGFQFRVTYYDRRIAAEFFHAITDGTGGLSFLKTLVAEYLTLKRGLKIPRGKNIPGGEDILDCAAAPTPAELEDSYIKYAGGATMSRSEKHAYTIKGTPEPDGFVNLTCGEMPVSVLLKSSREKGVTITQYLTAVMIMAINDIQKRESLIPMFTGVDPRKNVYLHKGLRPVKICLPINLRKFFKSETVRNFAIYVNPGIEAHMGEYDFDEVLAAVYHFMGAEITVKNLRARLTTNVRSEQNPVLRVTPLFLKNPAMKTAFVFAGDKQTSSTISNVGQVSLPEPMSGYVERMEFILGPLMLNPVACAVLSYGDKLYFNITRTIDDPKIEQAFFTRLIKQGIPVKISSNRRED